MPRPAPCTPRQPWKEVYRKASAARQIYSLERLWYSAEVKHPRFSRQLLKLIQHLGNLYEVEQLAARYDFTGRRSMSIAEALEIKAELEEIDRLIKQLEEARENAQIGIIDLDALAKYTEPNTLDDLQALRQTIENYLHELAKQQGLENASGGYQLTPHAYRLFQGKLLERIFSELQASRTGRHQGPVEGDGAVELPQTKRYEFGDSLTQIDLPQSLINAMLRQESSCRFASVRMTSKSTVLGIRPSAPPWSSWT